MKKTYITPAIEVVRIHAMQMLAGSLDDGDTPDIQFNGAPIDNSDDGYDAD